MEMTGFTQLAETCVLFRPRAELLQILRAHEAKRNAYRSNGSKEHKQKASGAADTGYRGPFDRLGECRTACMQSLGVKRVGYRSLRQRIAPLHRPHGQCGNQRRERKS